jgi:hypothetical protein
MNGKFDPTRGLRLVQATASTCDLSDAPPEMYLYRDRTVALLRRYFRLSVELGRVPALLGREFFRSRVTSYRMHNFEDVVIFVHDMEQCLEELKPLSRSLIARIALQEHTQAEAARLLGCSQRLVERRYPEALDALSYILLQRRLLETADDRRRDALPPRKPVASVHACQEPEIAEFPASRCSGDK